MNNKEIFIYYSSPEHWFQTALELNETIKELFLIKNKAYFFETYHLYSKKIKRPFCSKSIYLLMTFAIENLIKGLLVLRNPRYVSSGSLDKDIKTHDLQSLVEKASLRLLMREIKLITKLTHIGLSTARYPVGLNEHFKIVTVNLIEKDEITYNKLFIKLRNQLVTEFNKRGWDTGSSNPALKTKPGEFKFITN